MSVGNSQFTRTNSFGPGPNYPRFLLDSVEDQIASANSGRPIASVLLVPGLPWWRRLAHQTIRWVWHVTFRTMNCSASVFRITRQLRL